MSNSSRDKIKVERWNPWKEFLQLEKEIDKLFTSFVESLSPKRKKYLPVFSPPTDIYQTAEEIVIRIALPGVVEDDIDIFVESSFLIIRGERTPPADLSHKGFIQKEWRYGLFERRIELPGKFREEVLKARFEDGLLEIRISLSKE